MAEEIRSLKVKVLADLAAAHDYYADTRMAWRVVQRYVKAGRIFTVQNTVTGRETNQAELAARARDYVAGPLAEATFQQFISIFERWFFDLLRLWLASDPRSLSEKTVTLRVVLDAPDKPAIAAHIIDRHLNELTYKNVRDWFGYLERLIKPEPSRPSGDEIARIAEAKASRDILVHSRGVANEIYEGKAGALARVKAGEPLRIPEPYHRQTWQLLCKVIADISGAVVAKCS